MAALQLASELNSEFKLQIITHGSLSSTSLFDCFSTANKMPHTDPYGNKVEMLNTGIKEKLVLLPLLIWNLPKFKKPFIFDLLYFCYYAAFKNKLLSLIGDSDIVHCISTGYLARCISHICKKKGIPLIHSPFIHFGKWGDSPSMLVAYSVSDALVCPTRTFIDKFPPSFTNHYKPNLIVIPPITADPVIHKNQECGFPGKYILFLGRKEKHKGLHLLLSAYRGLESLGNLLIAGPGEKVKTAGNSIMDLGEVNEVTKQKLLSSCSLLCVPSIDESFGIIYTEAMSYSKPSVALDVSPVNEIIENGKTGILVQPNDAENLHQTLKMLLSDDLLRENMGNAAKDCFNKKFSKKFILQKYKNLYRYSLGRALS